jgi:predicted nuclease of predicted toxin-antitoxin system
VKLLLDEHYSPRIAEHLRAQGHDVMAVAAQPALAGLADRTLITAARRDGRALLTENVGDFMPIAAELTRTGTPHAGIILANPHRFPRSRDGIGRLVEALHDLLVGHPQDDAFADRIVWLGPATEP